MALQICAPKQLLSVTVYLYCEMGSSLRFEFGISGCSARQNLGLPFAYTARILSIKRCVSSLYSIFHSKPRGLAQGQIPP
jgi:hypothetical protein